MCSLHRLFFVSVFSRSRKHYLQHLPRWRAACCALQLPSLLGLDAWPQSASVGRTSASETDLSGLLSGHRCRQRPVLESAGCGSAGLPQAECGRALGQSQGRRILYQVVYTTWMPCFACHYGCWSRCGKRRIMATFAMWKTRVHFHFSRLRDRAYDWTSVETTCGWPQETADEISSPGGSSWGRWRGLYPRVTAALPHKEKTALFYDLLASVKR